MVHFDISDLQYADLKIKDFKLCVKTKYPRLTKQVHPYVQGYIDDIVDAAKKAEVDKLYLFGSAITSAYAQEVSDIDFAVLGDEKSKATLHKSLTQIIKTGKEFDLVDIDWFNGKFSQNILEGVLLYAKNSDKQSVC